MSESYAGKINRKLLKKRRIIHAAAGYRIGSIDTALSFCRGWQTESPHRPRAQ